MDRLEHDLLTLVGRASAEHGMIRPGDRVMVAMSGGKDSYVMLHLLRQLRRRAPFDFELIAVHLDQGHPEFPVAVLEDWLSRQEVPYEIVRQPTYGTVKDKTPAGKAYCSLCSRLRRGILYAAAERLGCTRLALGHHRDDSVETLLLNALYSGQLKAMPPRLVSDDGRNTVIRPLILCAERDIARLAERLAFPILPCTLCSEQPDLQRARVKRLLDALEVDHPHVRASVFAAIGNVRPTHLMDPALRPPQPIGRDEHVDALGGRACG